MSNENREEKIGAHSMCFEAPDVVVLTLTGDVAGEEQLRFAQFLKDIPGKVYLIVSAGGLGSFTTAAKKAIKEVPPARAVIIHGASRQMQLVLSILNKVYMMVNLGTDIPLSFVANDGEARKWVDFHRTTRPEK
ncbi:MAG: hypothetical protein U0441_26290 [Polyangiaceae bacterium]